MKKINNYFKTLGFLFCMLNTGVLFSQSAESTDRNELGMDAIAIFKGTPTATLLYKRFNAGHTTALRLGLSGRTQSDNRIFFNQALDNPVPENINNYKNVNSNIALNIGFQKQFYTNKMFSVYYATDLAISYSYYKTQNSGSVSMSQGPNGIYHLYGFAISGSKVNTISTSAIGLLGAQIKLGQNLSFFIESSLLSVGYSIPKTKYETREYDYASSAYHETWKQSNTYTGKGTLLLNYTPATTLYLSYRW